MLLSISTLLSVSAALTLRPAASNGGLALRPAASSGGLTRPRRAADIVMGGGIVQPRPNEPRTLASLERCEAVADSVDHLPRLVVLDLDNTVWTPELYTLRHLPGYAAASPPNPVAGDDVWLLDGALEALYEMVTSPRWAGSKIAIASRTNKGPWAHALLKSFDLPTADGSRSLSSCISHAEIYPGSKTRHFERLREESGIAYEDMLFFDDSRSGKYGNCEPVSQMGVLSVHTPDGLTSERCPSPSWAGSLARPW